VPYEKFDVQKRMRVQSTFPRQFSRPVCINMKTLDGKLIRAHGWYDGSTGNLANNGFSTLLNRRALVIGQTSEKAAHLLCRHYLETAKFVQLSQWQKNR